MKTARTFNLFVAFLMTYLILAQNVTQHRNWSLLDHENCGDSITDRIIGGTIASLGQFPWMALLGYINPSKGIYRVTRRYFKCGGSLINKFYVLTAAHCVISPKKDIVGLVRLGEYDTRTTIDCVEDVCATPPQEFKPANTIVHDKYQHPNGRNDIALIRLDRPAKFNDYISPICLPYGTLLNEDHLGKKMDVCGWGVDNLKLRVFTSVLKVVKVPVVTLDKCEKAHGKSAPTGYGQLCAGGVVGNDSCSGDSGGPLMAPEAVGNGPPKYFLIGIVSLGDHNCGNQDPAIYTDVAKYMTWILDHIVPPP